MSKAGKLVKDLMKAKKESVMGKLGDSPYEDPMEPWSAKYAQPVKEEAEQVDEGDRQTLAKKLTNKMYSIDKGLGKLAKDQNRTDISTNLSGAKSDMRKAVRKATDSDVNKMLNKEEAEQLDESDPLLFKYIRSLGYNPEQMDFASRSKYARSNAFKNYKISHMNDQLRNEDVEELDEAGTGLLMSFIKAKGLNPLSMDGNQKKAYSRSSEFRIFKNRHVSETSGMGERGDDWNEASSPAQQAAIAINMQKKGIKPKKVQEEADAKDTVCFDIPLLIRVLEFTREDMKTDIELHNMVERLIDMRHDVPLTMEHYDAITGKLKESVSYKSNTGRDIKTSAGHTIVGQSFNANGTKHSNIVKHGETGKFFAAGGSSSHPTKTTTFHDSPEDAAKSTKSYVKEGQDKGEYDYEGAMAKTQLQTICRNADDLKNMLEDDENLPEWVQAKITKAEDYITTSLDYLKSTKELDEEVEPLQELKNSTLKSYVDKVSTGPSRGMTPKGTLKSIKAIGGVTKAIRKQYEKPLAELKKQDDNMEIDDRITREEKKMKGADPCWTGYQMVGTKKKGGRTVPNCVPEEVVQEGIGGIEDSPMSATNSVKAMESEQRKKNMKSARIIKSIYKKKGKNESMYDWEKDDKPNAKITLQGGTTMTGQPRDTVEIEPVLKTRPNSQKQ
jgi:hypothetical protein